MSKHKFKVGDLVRLRKNVKPGDRIDGYSILPSMYECLQRPGQIKKIIYLSGQEIYVATVNGWFFPFNSLELAAAPEKIIIYRNGNQVIAKNTFTGKTGVAKCNPADEFDFNTGAKLAFDRLVEPEPEKPKYYTGKVVCVDDSGGSHTKGKIYEVSDGQLDFNGGYSFAHRFETVEQINDILTSKFIELVE